MAQTRRARARWHPGPAPRPPAVDPESWGTDVAGPARPGVVVAPVGSPAPPDGSTGVTILDWHVSPLADVARDDALVDVVTDAGGHATLHSPVAGRVMGFRCAEGQHGGVDEPLLLVAEEPLHVVTPSVALSPRQEQVWQLVTAWSQERPQPRNLLRWLEARCPWPPGEGLRKLPYGVSWGETPVHVFGFPGGELDSSEVPAFVLVLSLDPLLGDEHPPAAHVLTADLGLFQVRLPLPAPEPPAVPGVLLPPPVQRWQLMVSWRRPGAPTQQLADSLDAQALLFTCVDDSLEKLLVEVLGTPPAEGSRTQPDPPPGAGPAAGPATYGPADPYAPSPSWREDPFPEAAVPGEPPPPLPGTGATWVATPVPREPREEDAGVSDRPAVALRWTLAARARPWRSGIVATPPADWAPVRILRLRAGMRSRQRGEQVVMLDEDGVPELVAAVLDVRSLPAAGILHSPLSRLRMLHQRLLTAGPGVPTEAGWDRLLDHPAVLDRFVDGATGRPSGFSLACDTGLPEASSRRDLPLLALVAGTAPAHRSDVVEPGIELARLLNQSAGPIASAPLSWVAPPEWTATEELQLSTETTLATVGLTPLWDGADLAQWEDREFGRAPFLRGRRDHVTRDVDVPGLAAARLYRFDWQPSGMARTLTTLCLGVTAGDAGRLPMGFTMTIEKPLSDEALAEPADQVLAWLAVDAHAGPSTAPGGRS